MKIGIIVYSKTGHTLSVGEKLKEKLSAQGHEVAIERIVPTSAKNDTPMDVTFGELPDISPYEGIIFAAPTQAFSLCPVMKAYLPRVQNLSGKKIACLTTQHFAYAWLGGNNAIRKMRNAIESKGGVMMDSRVVNWSRAEREDQITRVVNDLVALF